MKRASCAVDTRPSKESKAACWCCGKLACTVCKGCSTKSRYTRIHKGDTITSGRGVSFVSPCSKTWSRGWESLDVESVVKKMTDWKWVCDGFRINYGHLLQDDHLGYAARRELAPQVCPITITQGPSVKPCFAQKTAWCSSEEELDAPTRLREPLTQDRESFRFDLDAPTFSARVGPHSAARPERVRATLDDRLRQSSFLHFRDGCDVPVEAGRAHQPSALARAMPFAGLGLDSDLDLLNRQRDDLLPRSKLERQREKPLHRTLASAATSSAMPTVPPRDIGSRLDRELKVQHKETVRRRRIALIWGNSYETEKRPLHSCALDAKAIKDVLERSEIGFQTVLALNQSREEMVLSLHKFRKMIGPGDVVLFYFSGHGLCYDGVLFLVPNKMPAFECEADVPHYAVSLHDVVETFSRASGESGVKLMIVDACRDRMFERVPTKSLFSKSADYSKISRMSISANKCIIYATADATVAYAGGKGQLSQYTKTFIRHVTTPGQELFALNRTICSELYKSGSIPHCDASMLEEFYFVNTK